ncbi:MAG: NAD(P)H-binding protein, partial [Rariglobus sp.]
MTSSEPTRAMAGKVVLVAGATGLVGRSVLVLALKNPAVAKVVAPTRRALPTHPKLENPLVDFNTLPANAAWWQVDAVICALGTTQRQAGSKEAFRRVDVDYPLAIARLAHAGGAGAFALNSAVGANASARNFYVRTKGEAEDAVRAVGFQSLTIVRPSLIGGKRDEFRLGERVAEWVLALLGPLVPRRYRTVPAERIAQAL